MNTSIPLGLETSRLIFGCANFGGFGSNPKTLGKGQDEKSACEILNVLRDAGIYQFDTANTYAGGESERMLGSWLSMQSSSFRNRAQVATKVGNPFGAFDGEAPLCKKQILFHLDKSLSRLKIEQIAIYYLHVLDGVTPYEETLEAFETGVRGGKIKDVGLSNVTLDQLRGFLAVADEGMRSRIRYVQNEFNFLQQKDALGLIPYLEKEGLKYVAYSPLAGGILSGKYKLGVSAPRGSRLDILPEGYEHYLKEEVFCKIDELNNTPLGDLKSLAAKALNFVMNTKGVSSVIIAPKNRSQFESLFG